MNPSRKIATLAHGPVFVMSIIIMHKNISTVDFSRDLADAEILSVAARQVLDDHLAH